MAATGHSAAAISGTSPELRPGIHFALSTGVDGYAGNVSMTRGHLFLLVFLVAVPGSSGCAAIGLTLLGVGAGISGGTGMSYALDSIVDKTFTVPEEYLHFATLKTFKRMDIEVKESEATESGRKIIAVAGDRTINIELDRLTTRTSRMRVTAKQGWFFRDRATAAEIIIQTERTLENEPVREVKPTLPAVAPKK